MSDHVDGPRQIGEPATDLTDLFAFTSPENPARTVLAANVFPFAGVTAMFSNAVNHAIVVRRVTVAGTGEEAKFKAGDKEYRFTFRFDALEHAIGSSRPVQRGTCTCPGGQTLRFTVDDEMGSSTPDGAFRVFAGLRSDPFYLAWVARDLKKVPNLLQHDNVLAIVVEFDTQKVLNPGEGRFLGRLQRSRLYPDEPAL